MSDDFSGVHATFVNLTTPAGTPTGYTAGDTMKVVISGHDVLTGSVTHTDTVTITVTAADGATGTVTVPVQLTGTAPTNESVVITGVTDSDGRTWAVDASGLFATAVA